MPLVDPPLPLAPAADDPPLLASESAPLLPHAPNKPVHTATNIQEIVARFIPLRGVILEVLAGCITVLRAVYSGMVGAGSEAAAKSGACRANPEAELGRVRLGSRRASQQDDGCDPSADDGSPS